MSDSAIINDCLHHHINQHIQLRRDFFDLCVYEKCKFNKELTRNGKKVKDEPNQECMAKIMRLIETLTDDERREWHKKVRIAREQGLKVPDEEPDEFPITLSYGGICKLLYLTYGESVVRNSVAELLRRKYIRRVQETNNSIPCYILNVKYVQSLLDKQAQERFDSRVSKSTATSKTNKPDKEVGIEIDSQGVEIDTQPSEIDSRAIEIDTNNNYYNNPSDNPLNKDTNMSSSDDAPSHQSEKEKKLEREVADLRAQIAHILQATDTPPFDTRPTPAGGNTTAEGENIQPETPAHHTAILEPMVRVTDGLTQESAVIGGQENTPSESLPQTQETPSNTQAVNDLSNQATEQPQQQASGNSPIAGVTTNNPPTTNNATPQKPRGGRGKSAAGVAKEEKPKLEVVKTPPQMPPAEMAWGTRKCMQKFDARREKLLIGTYAISQASTCAKGLAENYTEEDVDAVTEKMNNDPYWISRGGADICDVARNIHKEMNKLKPKKNTVASSPQSTGMRPATPIASMTRDEASKLAHDAIVEAKQYNIVVAAQAAPLDNNPDAWIVRVRWDDGSKDGMVYSIRTRGQWGKRLKEIQKMVDEDAKIALRRMEAK